MNVMDQDWSSIEDPDNSCLFPSSTSSASAIVNRNSISASSVAQHPPHSKHTSWIHNHQNHYQPRPQTVGNKATSRNLSAADDKENQSDSNVGQTKAAERTPDDETIMDKFVANCLTNCDFQMVEHILKTIVSLKDFDERKATAATKIVFKSIHKAMSSMANDNSMTTTISTASSDGDVHSNKWPNTSNTFSSTGLEKPKNSNQQVHDKPNTSSQTQSQLTTSTTTKAAIESISISDTSSNISINNGNNSNHKISDNQFTVHNNSPLNNHSNSVQQNGSGSSNSQSNQRRHKNSLSNSINNPVKDDQIVRLESDIKRLKADLQIARQLELDLHDKLTQQNSKECDWRHRLTRLQQDNENLQTKLHNLVTARQQDKQTINSLERKLQREKKSKTALEQQLSEQQLANEVQQQATQSMSTSANRTGEYSLMNHPTVYHVPIGSEYKSNGQKIKAGTAISLPEPEGPSHLLMQLKKQSQYSEFSVDDQKYQV